ncbi:allatostatin-A receptor-like [Babylonia areolata]|uniref:allatostatin-A receptor-like n=1 Tax=Babylonia areolata TaxID=304850 RepID=UPI003FD6600F
MTVQVLSQDVLVASILLGLTALVGLLGNVLMLRALLRYPALRADFFLVLGSVALADILGLLIAVPRHVIDLTMADLPITDAWCKASKYLDVGSSLVAAYHLVVLAVLRTVLVTTRGVTPPSQVQTVLCAAVLWVIALLAGIPFMTSVQEAEGLCHYTLDSDIEREVWLESSFTCFVPALIIIAFYIMAHVISKRYFEDSYSTREKQMSRLVTVIVGCFAVCQLPYRIFDIYVLYKESEAGQQEFPDEEALVSLYIARNYLLCLMMADKAARPVIYSKLAPQLAEAFDEVINCTLCHRAYTQARSGQARNRNSSSKTANGHSARIHSTSSNAPLTGGTSDVATSDATNVTELTSVEELEIVPL